MRPSPAAVPSDRPPAGPMDVAAYFAAGAAGLAMLTGEPPMTVLCLVGLALVAIGLRR